MAEATTSGLGLAPSSDEGKFLWKATETHCRLHKLICPTYDQATHALAKRSPWIHAWLPSSQVASMMSVSEACQGRDTRNTSSALQGGTLDAFVASLRACTKHKDLQRGIVIYNDILERGLLAECSDALITMYAKCGELTKARKLLDTYKSRDVITWTALIAGYARAGQGQDAIDCFAHMQYEDISPNAVTYICLLKACASVRAVEKGEEIYDEVARQGLQDNTVLGTALVDMYAKCGYLAKAQRVLYELSFRDVVAWNALISGYAQEGQGEEALDCFDCMQRDGIRPDNATYSCVLKACASIKDVDRGKEIHDAISRQGVLQVDVALGTALVDMYAKCGVLSKAQEVLEKLPSRNVFIWSALIGGYAQEGQGQKALKCLEQMQHESIPPNAVTYASILKACAIIGDAEKGKQIHDKIVMKGLLQDDIVLGSSLVHMYAKCGSLLEAQFILDNLSYRDVVIWNTLIAGYVQEGQGVLALNCFTLMKDEGIRPDATTYASILKACAAIGAIEKGKQVHDEIARGSLFQDDIVLGSCLVDMYAKCGDLSKAQDVLEKLPVRDVVCWGALIAGYVQEGQGEQALNCFEHMQREGVTPDVVTFGAVLNACSHLGLVEQGHTFFIDMNTRYGVKPNIECYTCMIDLFGRAGLLDKAVQLIHEMPASECSAIWLTLLAACRKCGDVKVGRWAFECAVQADKSNGPAYVLMENIYATAGMPNNAKDIEAMRINNTLMKKAGCSWQVCLSEEVHGFSGMDTTRAQNNFVLMKLKDMVNKIAQQGYSIASHCKISDAAEKCLICSHSEKLALACALINTPQTEPAHIWKSMQMCADCHSAVAILSKIEMRTIVIMGANFKHVFQDGRCFCSHCFDDKATFLTSF